jgi:Cu2+-exporting ATPase
MLLPAAHASTLCRHCGLPALGQEFCCPGCRAAYEVIQGLGLGLYYTRRLLDASQRALKPEPRDGFDPARFTITDAAGLHTLNLAVDGLQCGACVWLIESVLTRFPEIATARVNMSSRRLRMVWRGDAARGAGLCAAVEDLGYRLVPFDPACLAEAADQSGRELMRALAVAGFAAGNVMLLSLATWFGLAQNMGAGTRDLLHWMSALIAMPAVAYAGRPFFRSAVAVLSHGRSNMDVPISIGVILVTGISLWQTAVGGAHAYFDSAVTLLFFLLIGRILDHQARGRARATAEQLLLLRDTFVALLGPDGTVQQVPVDRVSPGDRLLVGMGERIAADGVVERGEALLDASLVTGESLPVVVAEGGAVFAGTLNLGAAITVQVTATGGSTLLAECVRLIEAAAQARGRFVMLAERVAQFFAPTVHVTALATFLIWVLVLHRPVAASLMTAAAVLIITCPCALALAVPAVQVIATGKLFRGGVLLKSPTALERLARVDCVVFDKTGTLTEPTLVLRTLVTGSDLSVAASLAVASRHPLCRALVRAAGGAVPAQDVEEVPGRGVQAGDLRLGSRAFCGLAAGAADGPELCLVRPGAPPVVFSFAEALRPDAEEVANRLRGLGLHLEILSGDHPGPVGAIAAVLGITQFHAAQSPSCKVRHVEALRAAGYTVLMIGDGLNDGPCLQAADVSVAPASAADVSQTVADAVFQGVALAPVVELLVLARRARRVLWQNLALSLGYNIVMVPLAVCGWVTPWLAALAMSSSSLLVLANAFRVQGGAR